MFEKPSELNRKLWEGLFGHVQSNFLNRWPLSGQNLPLLSLRRSQIHWALKTSFCLVPHYLGESGGRLRCRWCCSFLCPSFSRDGCVLLVPCRRFPFGCVYLNFLWPRASAVYLCLATGTMWAKLRSLSWWNAQMRRIKGFHVWLIRMVDCSSRE